MSEENKNLQDFESFLNDMRSAPEKAKPVASPAVQRDDDALEPIEEEETAPVAAKTKKAGKGGGKKKKKGVRVLVALLCVFAVLFGGGYFALQHFIGQLNYVPMEEQTGVAAENESDYIEEVEDETGDPDLALSDAEYDSLKEMLDQNVKDSSIVLSDENVWNILLVGADNVRQNTKGRSDSMILVSVSKNTEKIVLTSIMRDSYLKVHNYGYERINAALSTGGISRLVKTIETNFGIHVDNYAMVDFNVFQKVVNAIGGVYLNVTKEEVNNLNKYMRNLKRTDCLLEYSDEPIHLNGLQALYYARMRNIGNSDFDRTARQRKVIVAAKDRVLAMDLKDILALITEYLPAITTDIDVNTCVSLLFSAYNMLQNYDIEQLRFPVNGSFSSVTIDGKAVLRIDSFNKNINAWKNLVYGK